MSLPVEAWPAVDQRLLADAFREGDLLGGSGPGVHLRPVSRQKRIYGYGYWLRFLQSHGRLDPDLPPADRATTVNVAAFIHDAQQTKALSSIRVMLEDIVGLLGLMQPDADLKVLRRALSSVKARASPARPIQPRLVPIRDLLQAGLAEMQAAEERERSCDHYRAAAYRDGLAVALLAACPLRRRSFVGLRIGTHLQRVADGYLIHLDGADLKCGGPLDFSLPVQLEPLLQRYLDVYRPQLLRGATHDALWISARGRPMCAVGLSERIGLVTRRRTGRRLPMHLFRHAAATAMAIDDPHHVRLITALLGHSTLATAERYYNMATSLEAAGNYQQQLMGLRRSAT